MTAFFWGVNCPSKYLRARWGEGNSESGGEEFQPHLRFESGPAFPTLSNHVMAFMAFALQSQQDDEQQNERNAAELSVRGSRQGTGCIVYYRSRYLEVIPQCVRGKINRAYIGMHFAYAGDFHIKLRPCEVRVSIAPGEAVLSPLSTLAPPQIDQRQ